MGSPQNARRGLQGNQSTRPEPQHAWDSFLLASGIPEVPKENCDLRAEAIVSLCADTEVEETMLEGCRLENTLPLLSRYRGGEGGLRKTRKLGNTKTRSNRVHDQLSKSP
jgi:hypothetical protein